MGTYPNFPQSQLYSLSTYICRFTSNVDLGGVEGHGQSVFCAKRCNNVRDIFWASVNLQMADYTIYRHTTLLKIFRGCLQSAAEQYGGHGDTTDESPVLSMVFRRDLPTSLFKVSSGSPPLMIYVPLVKHCKPRITTNHEI